MARKSRIIIVGSGIVGASTAYHLAQLGWKDMVILDQGPLFETGGSTSQNALIYLIYQNYFYLEFQKILVSQKYL